MQRIVVFGAGVVFEKFVSSGDADAYELVAVFDNNKQGDFLGFDITKPRLLDAAQYDAVVLALWDKAEVIDAVSAQLIALGYPVEKILAYSYDRHCLVNPADKAQVTLSIEDEQVLYAYYDLNSNSETYDITSFLAIADCYREQQGLKYLHPVIVARDEAWHAQAYCLEIDERLWRAENIVKQACHLIPAVVGMTYCTHRQQAQHYLDSHTWRFPVDYRLDNPPPISVHRDFYYWLDQGFDPRRFKAPAKGLFYVREFVEQQLPASAQQFICVTLRESTLQPKRNSNLAAWNEFFEWLAIERPWLSVVVIRDTEAVNGKNPFTAKNVVVHAPASFHMGLRMALYEAAYLNMGCSNGPKQLCHLSKTASYITNKMIIEDYQGSSSARFIDRNITIGAPFRFASPNQMIDWRDDDLDYLIDAFKRFEAVLPAKPVKNANPEGECEHNCA